MVANEKLTLYIKEQLWEGFSGEVIKRFLLKAGWADQDVNQAFVAARSGIPIVAGQEPSQNQNRQNGQVLESNARSTKPNPISFHVMPRTVQAKQQPLPPSGAELLTSRPEPSQPSQTVQTIQTIRSIQNAPEPNVRQEVRYEPVRMPVIKHEPPPPPLPPLKIVPPPPQPSLTPTKLIENWPKNVERPIIVPPLQSKEKETVSSQTAPIIAPIKTSSLVSKKVFLSIVGALILAFAIIKGDVPLEIPVNESVKEQTPPLANGWSTFYAKQGYSFQYPVDKVTINESKYSVEARLGNDNLFSFTVSPANIDDLVELSVRLSGALGVAMAIESLKIDEKEAKRIHVGGVRSDDIYIAVSDSLVLTLTGPSGKRDPDDITLFNEIINTLDLP